MNKLLDKLSERRRDSIWCFVLGLLSLGYAWATVTGGQFLVDNNAPLIIMVVSNITTSLLGTVFGVAGAFLLIHGVKVLVGGAENKNG